MLFTLRRLVGEVNAARDLGQALEIIVRRVKQEMTADVCSVYLHDPASDQYILMASDGLNPSAVGRVRFPRGEGLVSLVGETEEPVNLDNAPDHPRYRFIAETGEARYHAFLGVPIIHHRQVMGILVVRQHSRRLFAEDEVAFLLTVASQLAGAIAHAQASGSLQLLDDGVIAGRPVDGQPGAPGVGLGVAVVVYPPATLEAVPDRKVGDAEKEVAVFRRALAAARGEIEELAQRMEDALDAEDRALFKAYLLMLDSRSMRDKIEARIRAGSWAAGALRDTILEHARLFESMEDAYLQERADDVRDLGRRILAHLQSGGSRQMDYPERTILVGENISVTMLSQVPVERLAGVVSVSGSISSHLAILSRALGVPAVLGADDLPVSRIDGREIVVDGYQGRVYISPPPAIREEYQRLAREEEELVAGLEALREQPAVTPDGVRVPIYANTGLLADITPSLTRGAEGVGLYRTEFPFMIRNRFPGEEEQRQIYRQVLEAFSPRPVVLRTLDIGGDKSLPYFPIQEDNPFLGWRGIRITLDHPEIFVVQLRAILRASKGLDNLRLLLPMVSHVGEVDEALKLVGRVHHELVESGEAVKLPEIGVMVEVPSTVYQIDDLARRVDFFSIGTNDLTQYLLAVDRNNARVASLYDALHPAVLRAVTQVVLAAQRQGKPVGVCGEMAGDPAAAILLLGMGVSSLSTTAASLPRIKWVIRNFSLAQARDLLDQALLMEDGHAIRRFLEGHLERAGLGGLVRAGK
ncbi:MAG TPA: phosphoenolpyruvate--protein phosphotransferase [Gammaproteobacteria bacterium]|nr:phosphoenolpyruvate--protein phosphotransferase [Gammaproteobacteria bacterium]